MVTAFAIWLVVRFILVYMSSVVNNGAVNRQDDMLCV